MKNIEEINQSNLKKITAERKHPNFYPGDIISFTFELFTSSIFFIFLFFRYVYATNLVFGRVL